MNVLRKLLLVFVVCVFNGSFADRISIPKEHAEKKLKEIYSDAKIEYFELHFSNGTVKRIFDSNPVEINTANIELQKVVMRFICPEILSVRETISSARKEIPDIVCHNIADHILPSKIPSTYFRFVGTDSQMSLNLNFGNENYRNYRLVVEPYLDEYVKINAIVVHRGIYSK